MYTHTDFEIDSFKLRIKKDEYSLSKVLDVSVKEIKLKDQIIRILCLSFLLSVGGWIFLPIIAPVMFGIGAIGALLTAAKYELLAEFRGSDETGNQWVPIARGRKKEEYLLFNEIEKSIAARIGFVEC